MNRVSIIVPIYNEEKTIEDFIVNLKKIIQNNTFLLECILVDDNSYDRTPYLLKKTDITVITHKMNLGYGASIKTGISKARGDIICIIDGDSTYAPADIQKLLPFIGEFDMIVGARTKYFKNFPVYQKMSKIFICWLLGLIYKQKVTDVNSGLRLMRKSVIEKYLSVLPDGFSFTASITLMMLLDNHRIKYVPITYYKRQGKSKVKAYIYTTSFISSYIRIILHNIKSGFVK